MRKPNISRDSPLGWIKQLKKWIQVTVQLTGWILSEVFERVEGVSSINFLYYKIYLLAVERISNFIFFFISPSLLECESFLHNFIRDACLTRRRKKQTRVSSFFRNQTSDPE